MHRSHHQAFRTRFTHLASWQPRASAASLGTGVPRFWTAPKPLPAAPPPHQTATTQHREGSPSGCGQVPSTIALECDHHCLTGDSERLRAGLVSRAVRGPFASVGWRVGELSARGARSDGAPKLHFRDLGPLAFPQTSAGLIAIPAVSPTPFTHRITIPSKSQPQSLRRREAGRGWCLGSGVSRANRKRAGGAVGRRRLGVALGSQGLADELAMPNEAAGETPSLTRMGGGFGHHTPRQKPSFVRICGEVLDIDIALCKMGDCGAFPSASFGLHRCPRGRILVPLGAGRSRSAAEIGCCVIDSVSRQPPI